MPFLPLALRAGLLLPPSEIPGIGGESKFTICSVISSAGVSWAATIGKIQCSVFGKQKWIKRGLFLKKLYRFVNDYFNSRQRERSPGSFLLPLQD